jgi:cellulose synthase/poly-beta-1,6-N-acetylglucosamine synthase-like glycosyltransferase
MIKKMFSIVIPTLNEEKYLPLLLKDLSKQTFQNFEVIHIDGNSEDKTIESTKDFKKQIDLKSFVVKKRNVSFQRNFGGKKAQGEWIIFMDADNRLPTSFLNQINKKIEAKKIDAFTTHIKVNSKNLAFKTACNFFNLQMDFSNSLGLRPKALGSMIGIKKEIINKIQFNEKSKVCEDALFIEDIKKLNYKFAVLKRPKYFYSFRRINKEGVLKMLKIISKLQLQYVTGNNFEKNDCGYEMKGGSYYEKKS